MISQKYSANTNSIVSALKQRIAESRASQEALKQQAPQQYDPLRAQSEVAKNQSLRSVLERNANLGDRGGIGRSEALATQTAGENRLGAINLQQQNLKNRCTLSEQEYLPVNDGKSRGRILANARILHMLKMPAICAQL